MSLHYRTCNQFQYILARAALREAADKLFICTIGPMRSDAEWEEAFENWLAASEYVETLKRTGLD